MRTIGFAYREMDMHTWNSEIDSGKTPLQALEDFLEEDPSMTLIGIFGLKDSLRAKVQSCVHYARFYAQLGVRLVSGDHMDTARQVALKSGIMT